MTRKHCACCRTDKEPDAFPKDSKRKDGLHPYCRTCVNAKSKAYYEANLEKARAKRKEYDAAHSDEKNARTKAWRKANPKQHAANRKRQRDARKDELNARERAKHAENPEYRRGISRRHYKNYRDKERARGAEHARSNPEQYVARAAARRARRLQATPGWDADFTKFVTLEAAKLARLRKAATGFVWHVDHTVPLKGKDVCGLHVWNNLQVIPAEENQRKYNRTT